VTAPADPTTQCPEAQHHGNPFRYCPVKGCGWTEAPRVDQTLRELYGFVWCLTCETEHVPQIQAVTFQCADCGFGASSVEIAVQHASAPWRPEHIVYAVHHRTGDLNG
jgi:hypothetical protein